jgi:hypothetical protein
MATGARLLVGYTLRRRITQRDQFAERIFFLGKWSCWVSTDDGHNFAAVNTLQDEVALIHCDHPIPLRENRIVGHDVYDACFHIPDTSPSAQRCCTQRDQQVRAVFVNFHAFASGFWISVQSLP